MSIKKICALLLLFSMTLGILASCRDQSKEVGENIISLEKLKDAVIVRPDRADKYITDSVTEFKELVKEKYDITLSLSTDWVKPGEEIPEDSFEILIGNTNRRLSEKMNENIDGDFCYSLGYDGKKLAFDGDNYLSLCYAFSLFEVNFMNDDKITIAKDTVISDKMTDKQIDYIRNKTGAGIHVGLSDTLDESKKKHGNYTLVWSEEFNSDKIDKSKWVYDYGYIANNELQYYNDREDNSRVDSDCLIIEARRESMNGYAYTSARLKTQGKFSFKYGYIEMRAILPKGQGIWPAFWMMGNSGSWPACGEIDIMEKIGGTGRENTVHGTVHWGTSNPYNHMQYGNSTVVGDDLSGGFHTYAVEWSEKYIRWFVDDKQYCEIDISQDQFQMFKQEFYILINLAVGGDWPGSPNAETIFPQRYIIDYIRVYQ